MNALNIQSRPLPRTSKLNPFSFVENQKKLSELQLKSIKIYLNHYCPDVEILENQKDLESTFFLRYQAFKEEQGLTISGNESKKWAFDGRDKTAIHIGVKRNGEVVGCCRIHLFDQSDAPDRDLFDMDALEGEFSSNIAMASKIVVQKDYRATNITKQLTDATYIISLVSECEILLGGCQSRLLPFYFRLGFQLLSPPKPIAGIGEICPLIFKLKEPQTWRHKNLSCEKILETYQNSNTTFGLFQLN